MLAFLSKVATLFFSSRGQMIQEKKNMKGLYKWNFQREIGVVYIRPFKYCWVCLSSLFSSLSCICFIYHAFSWSVACFCLFFWQESPATNRCHWSWFLLISGIDSQESFSGNEVSLLKFSSAQYLAREIWPVLLCTGFMSANMDLCTINKELF